MPPAGTPATGAARTGVLILACATPLALFLAASLVGTSLGTGHIVWTTPQRYLIIPLAALIGWSALLFTRAAQLARAGRTPAPAPAPAPPLSATPATPAPPTAAAAPPAAPPVFTPAPPVIPLQPDPSRTPPPAPPRHVAAANPYFPAR